MTCALVVFSVIAAIGCNQVYDLEPATAQLDAPAPTDSDSDEVPDGADNCIDLPNTDQRDGDDDGRGDICDNCPLVANPSQETLDGDQVGDDCDAHPTTGLDCLVLLDRFDDPLRFSARWEVLRTPGAQAPMIEPKVGSVVVTPTDTFRFSLLARDDNAVRFDGRFDTQVRARTAITTGIIFAVSNMTTALSGYGCGVGYSPFFREPVVWAGTGAASGMSTSIPRPLSAEPASTTMVLRLFAPADPATESVHCRAEYGFAAGTSQVGGTSTQWPPATGAAGVSILADVTTVEAVALYREQTQPCAPTIYR